MADIVDMFTAIQSNAWGLMDRAATIAANAGVVRHNRDRWRWLAQQYRRRAKELERQRDEARGHAARFSSELLSAQDVERERVLAILGDYENRIASAYYDAARQDDSDAEIHEHARNLVWSLRERVING